MYCQKISNISNVSFRLYIDEHILFSLSYFNLSFCPTVQDWNCNTHESHELVSKDASEYRIAEELRLECRILQAGAGEAHSAGPGSLYQRPAGKLSVAAEPLWADSGTGRDVDDKVHRLKWFSSEAQLRDSDIKAHTASFSLYVLHTHIPCPHHSIGEAARQCLQWLRESVVQFSILVYLSVLLSVAVSKVSLRLLVQFITAVWLGIIYRLAL